MTNILELPFETHPAIASEHYEVIGSEAIGIVKIKKYGCLTPNEKLAWEKYVLSVQNDVQSKRIADGEITIKIVTMMLQSRLNPEWNEESTRNIPNYPLVEAMFRFFDNERAEWTPPWKMRIEGLDGRIVAIQYAKENECMVLTRRDMPLNYVIVDGDSPPESLLQWDIIEDFTVKAAPKPRGKSKALTGQK